MNLVVTFVKERETKASVLYKAERPELGVLNVYIKMSALPRPFPERIKLTVEVAE